MDSKFGIPLDDKTIDEAMKKALNSEQIELLGFHFHIGSQLLSPENHLEGIDVLIELMKK